MENKSKTFLIIIIILVIMFIQFRACNFENELTTKGEITIGRIDSIQEYPKRSYICVSYYINGTKYNSCESGLHKNISEKDIGKFFNLKYLKKSPKISRGIYDKQITDTIVILNAGFSIADIKN